MFVSISPPYISPSLLFFWWNCISFITVWKWKQIRISCRGSVQKLGLNQPSQLTQGRWPPGLSHSRFSFFMQWLLPFLMSNNTEQDSGTMFFTINWFIQPLLSFVLFVISYSRLCSAQKYSHAAPSSLHHSERLPSINLSYCYCFLFLFPLRTMLLLSGGGTRINKMNKKNRFFLHPWNLSFFWGVQIFGNFNGFFFFLKEWIQFWMQLLGHCHNS